ncbi:MAG: serine/threonine protein kinase [Sandaracinaceae bacterium]|nr:serine/threonine protein kinase [Sandaracinaceae bacterium]
MPTTEELQATIDAAITIAGADAATIERSPRSTIIPEKARVDTASRRALAVMAELAGADAQTKLELSSTLGEGGMGVVRLGRQISLGREVAVKTLKAEHRNERSTLKLLREAWVTGGLEHPNVIPVYDIALGDDGHPLIVLKKIEGEDWASLMHAPRAIKDRFGVDDPLEWNLRTLMQVCNAVRFAHSRKVLHRDLKPENVMIGAFGEVYVVDWGIAVALEDDGTGRLPLAADAKELAGTPCYMAPEMLGGKESRLSERTDVYLLGAVLFEIVTGHPPHEGTTLMEIVSSVVESSPQFAEHVPAELERIVRRAMDPDPQGRFENVEQLRLAIQTFLQHRDAIRLADRAEDRLAELNVLLESLPPGRHEADEREPVYHLFGECRFGFRHALEAWPDNEAAQAGLDRATRTMVEYELAQGEPEAARALLTELRAPAPELGARVEDARKKRQAEDKELRKLQEDLDPSAGRRTRSMLALMLGTLWTLLPLASELLLRRRLVPVLTLPIAMLFTAGILAVVVALGVWARESMTRTAINRRLGFAVVAALVAQLILQTGDLIAGASAIDTVRHEFVLWTAIVAMLAYTVDRRLAASAAGYALGSVAVAWLPDYTFPIMSVCHFVLTVNGALLWLRPKADAEAARQGWQRRRRQWLEERLSRDRISDAGG